MIYLLQFTINVPKSHRQPQCTLQLVYADRVLFVWVDLHVSLCGLQHTKWASNSSCLSTLILNTSIFIQPHKQKSTNGVRSGYSNSSISVLDTCSYKLFFSQWLIQSSPKMLTHPPESPCIIIYSVSTNTAVSTTDTVLVTRQSTTQSHIWEDSVSTNTAVSTTDTVLVTRQSADLQFQKQKSLYGYLERYGVRDVTVVCKTSWERFCTLVSPLRHNDLHHR
jgi:hypothetical protein